MKIAPIKVDHVDHMGTDLTVVNALRRIPGVSVLPVSDNEHPRDEAISPVLRGLNQAYNNVTVNGLPIASTGTPLSGSGNAGRGVRKLSADAELPILAAAPEHVLDVEPLMARIGQDVPRMFAEI